MRRLSEKDFPALYERLKELDAMSPEERERLTEERERAGREKAMQEYREARLKSLIAKCGLGERFKTRTFETFRETPENAAHFRRFIKFAEDFGSEPKGLYLWGGCGTGKTHLAAAVVHALLKKGKKACFLPVTTLRDRIYESYRDHTTPEIVAELAACDLVVLDDFDKLRPNGHVQELVYGLINRLYECNRKTIFTANRPRHELDYDPSVLSRIAEMCRMLPELKGPDYRTVKE